MIITDPSRVASVAQDTYSAPYESYGTRQRNIEVEDGAAFEARRGPISGNTFDFTLVEG